MFPKFNKLFTESDITKLVRIVAFSVLIGIISGFAAIIFYFLIQFFSHFLLVEFCGYQFEPTYGEADIFHSATLHSLNRFRLLIIPAIGGLLSGFIVFKFAPEAQGHGTDSIIKSIHKREIRFDWKVPFIKALASAITIGSGGSAGREGPIAQIGGTLSGILANKLKLSEKEIRIACCCGMGAGVGAIFKTPLAGAIFGIEVLYRTSDMEYEALVPSIISSITSYSIFAIFFGFKPLFLPSEIIGFTDPTILIFYLVLGIMCAFFGALYVKSFQTTVRLFKKINIPRYLKPALGGLLAGVIAFFLPQMISTDYGQIQKMLTIPMPLSLLFLFIILKIAATSFTVGSGGSGGLFGPAIFIGASVGTFAGTLFHQLFPTFIHTTGDFTIVGMAGFFAGIARTPISTLLMVSDLTGNYSLFVPTMLVCITTFIFNRNITIYESQVFSRFDSEAHKSEYQTTMIESTKVEEIMVREIVSLKEDTTFKKLLEFIPKTPYNSFPIISLNEDFVGIITFNNIKDVVFEEGLENIIVARELINDELKVLNPDNTLLEAINIFSMFDIDMIAVLDKVNSKKIVGILTRNDVMKAYNDIINNYYQNLKTIKGSILL